MGSHRRQETRLPEWLWFFLILPLGLITLLLWRQRQQLARLQMPKLPALPNRPRYVEPDSIPIEVHEAPRVSAIGEDAEDVALAKASESGEPAAPQSEPSAPPAEPDDLKVIEGIGPSIAALLNAQGIYTFRQLAEAPQERLDQILTEARLRHLADPGTWAEQANLAASGKWDDLEALQKTLKAGRRQDQA